MAEDTRDVNEAAKALLEDLRTAITDWKTTRGEEIDNEVRFLKSLDTSISVAANSMLLETANEAAEILTGLLDYSPSVADQE